MPCLPLPCPAPLFIVSDAARRKPPDAVAPDLVALAEAAGCRLPPPSSGSRGLGGRQAELGTYIHNTHVVGLFCVLLRKSQVGFGWFGWLSGGADWAVVVTQLLWRAVQGVM
jgi:hypothetical protein